MCKIKWLKIKFSIETISNAFFPIDKSLIGFIIAFSVKLETVRSWF